MAKGGNFTILKSLCTTSSWSLADHYIMLSLRESGLKMKQKYIKQNKTWAKTSVAAHYWGDRLYRVNPGKSLKKQTKKKSATTTIPGGDKNPELVQYII